MTKEIWKPIAQSLYYAGVDPIYEVSNTGKVRNKNTKHVLAVSPSNKDYNRLKVQVRCHGIHLSLLLSHVVYETFVGDCYGVHVKHKDGNPRNNAVENLYI